MHLSTTIHVTLGEYNLRVWGKVVIKAFDRVSYFFMLTSQNCKSQTSSVPHVLAQILLDFLFYMYRHLKCNTMSDSWQGNHLLHKWIDLFIKNQHIPHSQLVTHWRYGQDPECITGDATGETPLTSLFQHSGYPALHRASCWPCFGRKNSK